MHNTSSFLKTLVLMEIMEMQQDLMERLHYYTNWKSNAGLPAPKSAGYYYLKADTAALTYSAACHIMGCDWFRNT
jgi:hypothetical protein